MPVTSVNLFPLEALEANRRGDLSAPQLSNLQAQSKGRRRSELSSAGFFVAGALIVGFSSSPTASVVLRAVITSACIATAAVLVVRSLTGADPLTRDLRSVQVQSVEGAIGKRRRSASRSTSNYFLDVGDRSFKVGRATYAEAPEAAFVRLYFLPLSRKVVNLERLPTPPSPSQASLTGLASSFGAAILSGSRRKRNEARAEMASVGEAFESRMAPTAVTPPPHDRDPRPLAEVLVGAWTNGMMQVTFSADGRVTTSMLGVKRDGHWSVDAAGRLRADITGRDQTADAWLVGERLTIAVAGEGLTFTRE